MDIKSSKQIDHELKQMEAEMKGTVDINYGKYNTEFMGKVAEHNEALRREKAGQNDAETRSVSEEGSRYLHNKSKGRTIII